MHVEKGRVEDRKKKRRYRAAGRQSSHAVILMLRGFEVNERHPKRSLFPTECEW
jgi:hypothetical protein